MKLGKHEALLIIEDETGPREAMVELFGDSYRVEAVATIEKAISTMRKRAFAVAILDLVLPDGRGEDLLRQLKEAWPHTEVIVVTAVKEIEPARLCFELGAYAFFLKPYDIDSLSRSVRRAAQLYALTRKLAALESSQITGKKPGKALNKGGLRDTLHKLVSSPGLKYPKLIEELERCAVEYALAQTNWNQLRSARLLGMHRNTVVNIMKRQKLLTVPRPKGLKKKSKA